MQRTEKDFNLKLSQSMKGKVAGRPIVFS